MIPPKLKVGDEIRIIAPSRSISILSKELIQEATTKLEDLGLKVTFAKHVKKSDDFDSSSIKSRINDLHEAFKDKNVKAILTVIGGFNSNQLLSNIDYQLIKENPKIFCGYSDITALTNAIYHKTKLVTYSGPHFSSFGMKKGFEFTIKYFQKCFMQNAKIQLIPSKTWSDDAWYSNQKERKFIKNKGYWLINQGKAKGKIIGGNQCTLNLLQGTKFMPDLKNKILFIEDDYEAHVKTFDRDLQSLLHLPNAKYLRGIVIGRFQKQTQMTKDLLTKIIKTKVELNKIPVIANVDFGHTNPRITFPIGGECEIIASKKEIKTTLTKH